MFKLNEIKELIKLLDETSVQELEIENEGTRLSIRKPGKTEVVQVQQAIHQAPPVMQAIPQVQQEVKPQAGANEQKSVDSNLHTIVSPMVGTFYRSSSPEAAPYASVGDRVTNKSTVCIIEAMKLMNELEAEVSGQIVEVLVENGQLVEYGQPLFLVKPE